MYTQQTVKNTIPAQEIKEVFYHCDRCDWETKKYKENESKYALRDIRRHQAHEHLPEKTADIDGSRFTYLENEDDYKALSSTNDCGEGSDRWVGTGWYGFEPMYDSYDNEYIGNKLVHINNIKDELKEGIAELQGDLARLEKGLEAANASLESK